MSVLFVVLFFGTFIALWLVLEAWLRRQGYRAERSVPRLEKPAHAFSPEAASLTGGVRVGLWNATWPFARMTVDREYARIRGAMPRTVWVPRAGVVAVRKVRSPLGSGLRFETNDGSFDSLIFWSFSVAQAFDVLRRHGWPVAES